MIDHATQMKMIDHYLYVKDGGYQEVKLGDFTFKIGKDPSEDHITTYRLHWSSCALAEQIGVDSWKTWRSPVTFEKQIRAALVKWLRKQLKELT